MPSQRPRLGLIALASLTLTQMMCTGAIACGGILDVACNLQNGGLSPGNIAKQTGKAAGDVANTVKKAGQDVANALNELQASVLSGPTLEAAIVNSRNTAVNGSMPVPPQMRQRLTGYASEDSLNRARYKIGDSGFVNLAHLLEQGGLASAVTLIDVIVFRGPSEAADPSIWAHELHHVDQYRDWGVHSFAVQYARNWRSVEDPAYAKGNSYWAWFQSRGVATAAVPQPPGAFFPIPPPGIQVGNFCYTIRGRFGPGPGQPVGSPCSVFLPGIGNFLGQIGI